MENSQISQLTVRGIHARRILRQLIDAFEQARVECAREHTTEGALAMDIEALAEAVSALEDASDSWLHPIKND
jgi:anti-sigma28 factor (negative regulator of flagellin synthesis)